MYPGAHARSHPDEPAFIFAPSGRTMSWGTYDELCNRFARALRDVGLGRGDHLAVFMENNPSMLVAEGAAERSGLYYTCVNSYLTADEVAYIVNDSESQVVVTSFAKAEVAAELPERCPRVRLWLMSDGDVDGFESFEDVLSGFDPGPIPGETLGGVMLYSSGTTGRPKGILRPIPAHSPDQSMALPLLMQLMGYREEMTYLSPAPLYHSAPQASVAAAVRLSGTSVIMERFDPELWLSLVERHRVTHSQMVPTMFSRLLRLPDKVRAGADLSSLEVIVHAAAPCPVPVKQAMIDWLGPILLEYYGATEGNGFTWCDSEAWLAHPGTVGRAVLGDLVIRDEDGAACPIGTPGTVWFRGATSFTYFNDPKKTAESQEHTTDGLMSTVGDVGYVDDDGYLYLTDRKTYMIISGGVNIYPQECENLLATHPKVYDAAVIGIPDDDLGEEVKAVVQLMPGIEPTPEVEAEIIAFCRAGLAHFKCPRSVDFEDELPRLPTGKLYKRLLRDRYWENRQTSIV